RAGPANCAEINTLMLLHRLAHRYRACSLADHPFEAQGHQFRSIRVHSATSRWSGRADHHTWTWGCRTNVINNLPTHIDRQRLPLIKQINESFMRGITASEEHPRKSDTIARVQARNHVVGEWSCQSSDFVT